MNSFQENISKLCNEHQIIDDITQLFCRSCFKYPEYLVRFSSENDFELIHECIEGIKKTSFSLEQSHNSPHYFCSYCNKKCKLRCIKCKYIMCENCKKEHEMDSYISDFFPDIKTKNKSSVFLIENCQFICDKHLLKYEYYCPICRINLCSECIKGHEHIKCTSFYENQIKLETPEEPNDVFLKKLFALAQILYHCYNNNLHYNDMTLNILLNAILAVKIFSFIGEKSPVKNLELKNDFLINIEEKSHLCEKYDDEDFKKYYSNILNNVLSGNIYDYYALRNIRGKYQNTYSPNALFESNYINKLDCKIIRLVSNINTIDSKIDNIMTNLEFAKGIKAINCLRLKVEFLEFCMKLVQVTALTINYKLDYELRRKIGNIVGLTIIKNFSQNIESVEDSKKLLSSSCEKIEKRISGLKKIKKNKKCFKIKTKAKIKNLNTNLKNTLIGLSEKIKIQLENIDKEEKNNEDEKVKGDEIDEEDKKDKKNKKIKEDEKNNKKDEGDENNKEGEKNIDDDKNKEDEKDNIYNLICFNSLTNDDEEIKKAIICNLFFIIKWKLGDIFNEQIHNILLEIDSLITEEINNLEKQEEKNEEGENEEENEEEEKKDSDKKAQNKVKINNISKSNTTSNERNNSNKKECPNKYFYIKKLSEKIDMDEINLPNLESFYSIDDDDPIINSSMDQFISILKERKISYSPNANIDIEEALNFYYDGKKGPLLKKTSSIDNKETYSKEFGELFSEVNLEKKEVKKFKQNFQKQFKTNLNSIKSRFWFVNEELDNISQFFNFDDLLQKYNISTPLNPLEAINECPTVITPENAEEIYFLNLVFAYFFLKSSTKILTKINAEMENVKLEETSENNFQKKNIIKFFIKKLEDKKIKNNNDFWGQIKEIKLYVKNKEMNELIKAYVEKNNMEIFKNDLTELLKGCTKDINLKEKDPQNLQLEAYIIKNNLLDDNKK